MKKGDRKNKEKNTFYFWFCDLSADNLKVFKKCLMHAPIQSIEHHAKNHDFSKWLKDVKGRLSAKKFEKVEESLSGEPLRKKLLKLL